MKTRRVDTGRYEVRTEAGTFVIFQIENAGDGFAGEWRLMEGTDGNLGDWVDDYPTLREAKTSIASRNMSPSNAFDRETELQRAARDDTYETVIPSDDLWTELPAISEMIRRLRASGWAPEPDPYGDGSYALLEALDVVCDGDDEAAMNVLLGRARRAAGQS